MGKLFNLKEWLTVADAARHLTIVFGEDVTEADVLRLALDGRLPISVYFPRSTFARQMIGIEIGSYLVSASSLSLLSSDDIPCADDYIYETRTDIYGEPYVVPCQQMPENSVVYSSSNTVVKVAGLWNISMMFGHPQEIEGKYQRLIGAAEPPIESNIAMVISNFAGDLFELVTKYEESEYFDQEIFDENPDAYRKHYLPSPKLPSESYVVVRTEALREFEQSINGAPSKPDKPMATTERNTLLTIIAALCANASIKHQDRGAAGQIVRMTEVLGAPVSDDTVRRALEKIPDALESRMK